MGVLSLYSMSGDASGKPTPSYKEILRSKDKAVSEANTLLKGKEKISFYFLILFSMFVLPDGIRLSLFSAFRVGWLGHRQISPSPALPLHKSSTAPSVITYRPLSLYHVQRGYKRQRSARYVKKCLGWHFECRTRSVPTLRISTAHRTLAGVAHAACKLLIIAFKTA